nr:MAG TPA: hypothetical protein [Caudoviricetes sp.]
MKWEETIRVMQLLFLFVENLMFPKPGLEMVKGKCLSP